MSGRQTNVIDSNMQLLLVKDSFYNIRCLPFMKNRHTDSYIVQKRLDLLKYLRKVSTTVKNAIHMIIFYPIFGRWAKHRIWKNCIRQCYELYCFLKTEQQNTLSLVLDSSYYERDVQYLYVQLTFFFNGVNMEER